MRWTVVAALAPWLAAVSLGAAPAAGAKPTAGQRAEKNVAAAGAKLTAEQLVEKNVAARGGLEAWRKIQTMIWTGHLESEHGPMPSMPFVMEQKRPNQTHFEINSMGQRTVRVFDGTHGWKLRPAQSGRADAQPYTPEELKFAQRAPGMDGPLIDYAAKGNLVSLESLDAIEGRKAYRLSVRLASGEQDQLWVDAQTFLETRFDRVVDGAAGVPRRVVSIFYRDYKTFEGVQIPSVIETGTGPGHTPDKMVIERVVLNAPLDEWAFSRPGSPHPRKSARFPTGAPEARAPMTPPPPTSTPPVPDSGSPPQ